MDVNAEEALVVSDEQAKGIDIATAHHSLCFTIFSNQRQPSNQDSWLVKWSSAVVQYATYT